jgi:hypothetical protein
MESRVSRTRLLENETVFLSPVVGFLGSSLLRFLGMGVFFVLLFHLLFFSRLDPPFHRVSLLIYHFFPFIIFI